MADKGMGGNLFVKDYEPLRQTLMTLFLYGCYDSEQLRKQMKERGYRYESRTCETCLQAVRCFWRDAVQAGRGQSGRKIHYFPTGRYQAVENELWRVYGLKTILERDMNLFVFLPCVLRRIESRAEEWIMATVRFEIYRAVGLDIDEQAIRRAVKKMLDGGFLLPNARRSKQTRMAPNLLDTISEPTLRLLHELLFFYRDVLPLSSLGYALQRTIRDYLVYEQGAASLPGTGVFVHKDVFFQNILNDDILYQLFTAIEERRRVGFQCDSKRSNQRLLIQGFLPIKVIFDRQYGRQHLLGASSEGKYAVYRLDKMSALYFEESADAELPSSAFPAKMWSASLRHFPEPQNVVIDFRFPQAPKNASPELKRKLEVSLRLLPWRLRVQKRSGKLTQKSAAHFIYSVVVYDPDEMIPWIRSWAPYAYVSRNENPALAEKVAHGWRELLAVYRGNIPASFIQENQELESDDASLNETATQQKSKRKPMPPGLFLEFQNLYYRAIRAAMHLLSPKQEGRKAARWKPRDLVSFITGYAGIDNPADKYLNAISRFEDDEKELSLFKVGPDGFLRPAYPGTPPPILPSAPEKRYLRTLLLEPGAEAMLGEEEVHRLKKLLEGTEPFRWTEAIEERGANEGIEKVMPDPTWTNIRVLMTAIREGKCLTYANDTRDGERRGVMKPYRVMYSPQARQFQAIVAVPEADGPRCRLVLMNIRRLSRLSPAEGNIVPADPEALLRGEKRPPIHLVVHRRVGMNDIERAFLLFSNYERKAWHDDETGDYHIELSYYRFQYKNEILPRILSLGAAAEVLSPPEVREKILEIAKRTLESNSQVF